MTPLTVFPITIITNISNYLQNETQINAAIEERRVRLFLHKQPVRPFIVAIGKTKQNLEKFYFYFNTTVYIAVSSFLEALVFFFKFYLAFNLPYPLECENVCFFCQRQIFKAKRKSGEKELALVDGVVHKLSFKQKKSHIEVNQKL